MICPSAIPILSVFYVWAKTIPFLPVWPRKIKRLDSPDLREQARVEIWKTRLKICLIGARPGPVITLTLIKGQPLLMGRLDQ